MDKNKKKNKVVAIKYEPGDVAPKVIAKGQGHLADKILEKGQHIPVYKDEKLVTELDKVEMGNTIPPELYEAVAQVLVFISNLDRQAGGM